jgi:nitroreductase
MATVFEALARQRRSVRAFLDAPVAKPLIRKLLELASWSPSNCNSQPWRVYLASGGTIEQLRHEIIADCRINGPTPDIPYRPDLYTAPLRERQVHHVAAQQQALGIARDDEHARTRLRESNLSFFGAPHVALLYMPNFGTEREAGDIGMFAQTLLLAIEAHGLAAVPQTSIGMFAAPVHRVVKPEPGFKLLFAVSFGYEDTTHAGARLPQTRAPVDDFTTFLD